ncbi:hypothetical protein [Burkholderia phage BCSR5]|nr:hypothetical protein [Burkholderia phage BCSR5]
MKVIAKRLNLPGRQYEYMRIDSGSGYPEWTPHLQTAAFFVTAHDEDHLTRWMSDLRRGRFKDMLPGIGEELTVLSYGIVDEETIPAAERFVRKRHDAHKRWCVELRGLTEQQHRVVTQVMTNTYMASEDYMLRDDAGGFQLGGTHYQPDGWVLIEFYSDDDVRIDNFVVHLNNRVFNDKSA